MSRFAASRSTPQAQSGGSCDLKVGDTITLPVSNSTGVVRFVGTTHFSTGLWVGIELHQPHGRNDGSVQGQRYFTCPPKHGVFVRASSCTAKGVTERVSKPSSAPAPLPSSGAAIGASKSRSSTAVTAATAASTSGTRSFMTNLSDQRPRIEDPSAVGGGTSSRGGTELGGGCQPKKTHDRADVEAIVYSRHFQQAVETAVQAAVSHHDARIQSLEQEVAQLRASVKRSEAMLQQMQDHVWRATQQPAAADSSTPQQEALLLVAEMAKQAQELLRGETSAFGGGADVGNLGGVGSVELEAS